MGETVSNHTNGADHANSSSDSTAIGNPDDQPPIAGLREKSLPSKVLSQQPSAPVHVEAAAIEKPTSPHTLSAQQTAERFNTHPQDGLNSAEAAARLTRDGPNSIKGAKGISLWQILFSQVANALTVVLIAVAALSFAIGDWIEGGVVSGVILLNIVVGYVKPCRKPHVAS
jgi:Na+-exporting ATPase